MDSLLLLYQEPALRDIFVHKEIQQARSIKQLKCTPFASNEGRELRSSNADLEKTVAPSNCGLSSEFIGGTGLRRNA
jgi:hypothetical protein